MARKLGEVIDMLQDVSPAQRKQLSQMAFDFEKGCPNFLECDPFQLAKATKFTDSDDWQDFLSIREVSNWIDERLNMIIKSSYRKKMREMSFSEELNTSDINSAKLLRDIIKENERVDDTTKIIITRIPPKDMDFHKKRN